MYNFANFVTDFISRCKCYKWVRTAGLDSSTVHDSHKYENNQCLSQDSRGWNCGGVSRGMSGSVLGCRRITLAAMWRMDFESQGH